MTDGLKDKHRRAMIDILSSHERVERVVLFGSRAMGTFTPTSDVDIVLFGDKLTPADQSKLAGKIDELSMPQQVDLLLYKSIRKKELLKHIKEHGVEWWRGMGGEMLLGLIPDGWEYITLGEACKRGGGDIQTGPFGSQLHAADYVTNGIPSIMPQNIADNRIVEDGIARISPVDAKRLNRYLVRKGDIVYSRRGDVERRALIRDREDGWLCGTGCLRVRLGEKGIDPHFASFYLGAPSVREWIVRHAHGATMANLNTSILAACPFVVPPPDEQRAIAEILGSLDDKIELNRRMNGTLEAMARAIFKAWFIDFEPVKAKAAGATSFPGMPQDVFDQLPAEFTESELGPIPEGWEVKPLAETVKLTMGQSPKSEYYNQDGEGLPFHQGVSDHGFRFPSRRVYCTVEGRIAEQGDVLLSVRAPVGRINVADVRLVLGRGLAGMRHREGKQSFLLYQMKHIFVKDDAFGDGTVYKSVNKKFLETMPILAPQQEIVDTFEAIARPLDELIKSNEVESLTLAEIRDCLLPKLISGIVSIKPT